VATAIRCTMTHMPRRGMVRRDVGVGVGVGVGGRERAGWWGGGRADHACARLLMPRLAMLLRTQAIKLLNY
jgi:hypothetical protein